MNIRLRMNSFAQIRLQGIRFRARRTGNGQNGDGRRGVRGSGRREGRRKDEIRRKKDDWTVPLCSERRISGGGCRLRRNSCAQALPASMAVRSAGPSLIFGNYWQRYFLVRRSPWPQSGSRTRMVPSPRGISTGLADLGRWSNKSKAGSASSSGIHSRMGGEISNEEFRRSKLGD